MDESSGEEQAFELGSSGSAGDGSSHGHGHGSTASAAYDSAWPAEPPPARSSREYGTTPCPQPQRPPRAVAHSGKGDTFVVTKLARLRDLIHSEAVLWQFTRQQIHDANPAGFHWKYKLPVGTVLKLPPRTRHGQPRPPAQQKQPRQPRPDRGVEPKSQYQARVGGPLPLHKPRAGKPGSAFRASQHELGRFEQKRLVMLERQRRHQLHIQLTQQQHPLGTRKGKGSRDNSGASSPVQPPAATPTVRHFPAHFPPF